MRVLALAGDAGGACALAPVIKRLRAAGVERIDCLAYAAAHALWGSLGFSPRQPFEGRIECDHLLLGTSLQPEQWELRFIRQAARQGIPSMSLLDHWMNYRERFMHSDGQTVLPDVIAVMDERARDEMIALGFPSERLQITGNPVYDRLTPISENNTELKTHWTLEPTRPEPTGALRILWVSQPLSQLSSSQLIGFHENEALTGIIESLEQVLGRHHRQALLILKPHPRESSASLRSFLRRATSNVDIRLLSPSHEDPAFTLLACDWVFGMNSNLLMEACYLRKPAISYQPDLRIADALPSNQSGWSRAVYRPAELSQAIEEELFDPAVIRKRLLILNGIPMPYGATDRVLELLSVGRPAR